MLSSLFVALEWRHNGRDSVSNHQPHDCLLNRLPRRRSKETSTLRVTGLCAGNSPGTGEFPSQRASNVENVFIWWCHHGTLAHNTQEFCGGCVLLCNINHTFSIIGFTETWLKPSNIETFGITGYNHIGLTRQNGKVEVYLCLYPMTLYFPSYKSLVWYKTILNVSLLRLSSGGIHIL